MTLGGEGWEGGDEAGRGERGGGLSCGCARPGSRGQAAAGLALQAPRGASLCPTANITPPALGPRRPHLVVYLQVGAHHAEVLAAAAARRERRALREDVGEGAHHEAGVGRRACVAAAVTATSQGRRG
jgi:hypothetical protein